MCAVNHLKGCECGGVNIEVRLVHSHGFQHGRARLDIDKGSATGIDASGDFQGAAIDNGVSIVGIEGVKSKYA
jgi:hypothetical protein